MGRVLMAALFARLRAAEVPAIHLGCSPENASAIARFPGSG